MSERGSKKSLLFYLVLIVLIITLLPSSWKHSSRMTFIRLFSPVMSFVNDKTVKVRDTFSALFHIGSVKKENKDLRNQVESLKSDLVYLEELKLENKRLRDLLELKETFGEYDLVTANVIGRDATNWNKSIIIDKGEIHGVESKDPVVSYGGVVGIVFTSGRKESKIMLLNDNNSRVGVIVQRTRDLGVVEGQSTDVLILKYIRKTADIKPGDILITSGTGQIYPKGVKVGEIIKVFEEKFRLYKFAEVKPDVNFGKLEEVFVITRRDSEDENQQEDAQAQIQEEE
ncbi:MAG: rod shape-determining protein MreC [Candidatus Aureabacteria bacterium]|nr:rod shape-determining protein MreC [Candidatus Auribacterota bacterium]